MRIVYVVKCIVDEDDGITIDSNVSIIKVYDTEKKAIEYIQDRIRTDQERVDKMISRGVYAEKLKTGKIKEGACCRSYKYSELEDCFTTVSYMFNPYIVE